MPDYSLELAAGAADGLRVAGVDEVGRGCLAGPVMAAAAVLDPGRLPAALLDALDDSKRVPRRKREDLAARLEACAAAARPAVWIGHGEASVAEIESLNILRAAHLAMRRAIESLRPAAAHALVDGNLLPPLPCPASAIVGGDGRSLSIAAASIVAKVRRDRLMAALDLVHPGYGFARNAGYGTAAHRDALARHGPTDVHRRGFAPVSQALKSFVPA